MSTNSHKKEETQEKLTRCGFCEQTGVSLKMCGACGTVSYCGAACQNAGWTAHKADCKRIKKAKEAAVARGYGLDDMGSILAALNMPLQQPRRQPNRQSQPQPQLYDEEDLYDSCFDGHHEELKKMLLQRNPRLDVNWVEQRNDCCARSS